MNLNQRSTTKNDIKIMQLVCPTGFYGAERWILALANNLDTELVRCDLLAISDNSDLPIELLDRYPQKIGNIQRVEMNGGFDLKVINKVCKVINDRNIQILHTHGYKSDIIGLIAAKKSRIKCISTPHGFGNKLDLKLKIYFKLGCYALRFMDYVVPLSQQLFDDLLQLKIKPEKLRLIKNGVDLSEIDTLANINNSRAENSGKCIGFVGRLVPGKEVQEILHVFDNLWKIDNCMKLILIGDGEMRPELEKIASSLRSFENVEFLGFRDDRLELMKDFDVFVMTSSSEGIPRSLMEAMALNIPVVAYSIPGVRQLVTHEETGLLVEYGNRKALVAACTKVLTEKELSVRLSESGRDYIVNRFSALRMANEYTTLFESAIKKI